MKWSAQAFVSSILERVTMPEVYLSLRELIKNPESTIADYVKVVKTDPALSARIIRIANTKLFGSGKSINDLELAINFIGVMQLHDILLAILAIRSFSGIPNPIINLFEFWRASIYCGIVSYLLAKKCSVMASQRLFAYGLLHDIGHIIIYVKSPELAQDALMRAIQQSIPVYLAEREILGYDYASVGFELMRLWQLPESYLETMLRHPEPPQSGRFEVETAIVHVAHSVTTSSNKHLPNLHETQMFDAIIGRLPQISETIIEEVKLEAQDHVIELMTLLLPNPVSVPQDREKNSVPVGLN